MIAAWARMGSEDRGRTWMEPEERAYNTYSGGHSRSARRGRAEYPDGVVRSVTLGVADSFFSVPAHGRVRGRYVAGFVTMDGDTYKFTIVGPGAR